uniref:Keratin 18a, tandem duplicate 2 n=1 Tax=Cyprinus carpio TaxID=7962 RepID=A0A8C1ZTD0_CYPCA
MCLLLVNCKTIKISYLSEPAVASDLLFIKDLFSNKIIYRMSSEDLSMGSYSKDIFGSATVQMGLVGNEKVTMQTLNERLVSYSEKVRSLEEASSELEVKIRHVLEKKDPDTKDYSHYQATLDKLCKEILVMVKSNANVSLQIDNAKLAADDYRVKYENELHLRQNVEADINALKKMLDDTNVARLHLENDVVGMKVELMSELYSQINQSGVEVDVDALKGQDVAKIMEEMRAKYENIVLKNQEELKIWQESKISLIQVQVTENTEALKEAKTQVSVSHRQMQTLETELQTLIGSVRDSTLEYQALFNIKMVLEAEIATSRRLLDGEEHDTTFETVTQTLVNGKIVSSSSSTIKK